MSYPGYPPGPPGAPGSYPPGPPSSGPPQPGYPPGPSSGYPPQPDPQGGWMSSGSAPYPGGGPPSSSTPYPGSGPPSGPAPYPGGGPPSGPAPYPGGGPPGGAAPYPGGSSLAPYPGAGGSAPSYPPQQPGSGLGFGVPGPSQPGPAPYPPTQQYPTPPGPSSAASHAPYPTQASGGMWAPPPVPSAHTHYQSTHAHRGQDVAKVTKGVASMTVQPPKDPPTEGTVKPHRSFDAEGDAKSLRTAMKGFGTDEKAIIAVLANRSNEQRQEIKAKFKALYGKDLIKELKSELSGHFEDVILGLMMTPREFDAHIVRKAIEGAGTNESALIEVLCTRTNSEVDEIKSQYKSKYSRDLEKDVRSDTSGHFKRLLTSVLTGAREPDGPIDVAKARADAQALYQAGEARWGTDESKFNQILAARSYTHLRRVFDEYSKICKYDIEQSISREMSGDLKEGMVTIVKCVRDKPAYFAERLYKSMKGLGTDDDTLVRVMVTRCEVDMVQIKKIFYSKYHKTLGSFIKGDTSGDYKRVLMALAGEY